ncbi:cation transporter [Corynebacterium qintianiae]|uniref:Cation transporter n=1 Tax=Corynebacterium qintianiae TaxID=2709392 RepID=A0A7T0KNS0_9CORY|nr:cation diffusion facilitator family transporter [Corynebacterium qintianiae]QPK84065.1 cation transporter [Corynebacterium qintianiae]
MSHSHGHSHGGAPLITLLTSLVITVTVFLVELVGSFLSGSVALAADAMHMLSDSAGLIVAVIGVLIGRRAATRTATFGYARAEVFAALLNAAAVLVVTGWIVFEAVSRLQEPAQIETDTMMAVALTGLVANAVSAFILNRQRGASITVEGAFLHVIVDLFASVAVLVAGAVIVLTGFHAADVVASLIIASVVVPRAWQLARQSVRVLLEQAPRGFDADAVAAALRGIDGVADVHDAHVWSLDGTFVVATAHLVSDGSVKNGPLLDAAQQRLTDLGVDHPTVQIERPEHAEHEHVC